MPTNPSELPTGATPAGSDGWAEKLDHWSERISFEMFKFGIHVTMPALVVLVTLDVALRYFFNAPLEWARDVNGLLLLVTIFCVLPHAWDRAYHIRMEVFYSKFSPERRRVADVLSAVSGVVVFGLMAVQAALFVPFMIQTGETGEDLDFPLWPFMIVVAVCSVVVVARVLGNPPGAEEYLRYPSVSADAAPQSRDSEEGDPA